jgi:hypothetical protein
MSAMGLDNYAAHSPDDIELTEEDLQAFQDAGIELCGGIFSGDGSDGSFRGKVYASYVLEITGESLYAEWLPPETVSEMYQTMADYEIARAQQVEEMDPTNIQHSDLCKFFKVCSERGLGLVSWS